MQAGDHTDQPPGGGVNNRAARGAFVDPFAIVAPDVAHYPVVHRVHRLVVLRALRETQAFANRRGLTHDLYLAAGCRRSAKFERCDAFSQQVCQRRVQFK
ncbi:hypothetical protein D3C80_2020170 [compost metagenome]